VLWPQVLHALWLLVPLRLVLPAFVASPVAPATTVATPAAPPVGWFLAWLAGLALFGGLTAFALVRQRRRLRGRVLDDPVLARAAARLGFRRRVAVIVTDGVASPAVAGLVRPRILMPDVALSDEEREHVYLHELAHVQRGDLWVQALFGLVHLVFWFHPLVWIARSRAHALRELGCDARVAAVLREETPRYRETLLRFAERLLPTARLAGFLGGSAVILQRLRHLERGEWILSRGRRLAAAGAVVVLAAALVPRAQANVIAPSLSSLRASLAQRARHLAEHYESEGCLELQFTIRRLLQLEQEAKEER